jgi:hypothetical protein
VIAMPEQQQQYSRQYVVDLLNHVGLRELAEEALRDLPDPVDVRRLQAWCYQHGLSLDNLVSRMGGSP